MVQKLWALGCVALVWALAHSQSRGIEAEPRMLVAEGCTTIGYSFDDLNHAHQLLMFVRGCRLRHCQMFVHSLEEAFRGT